MEKPVRSHPVTINDVAQKAGLHKSTVSLALSGKGTIAEQTRRHIQAVAQEMGYEPNAMAQRLARRQGTAAIYLFSSVLDVGLATEKALLLQKNLGTHGLECPLYTSSSCEGQTAQIRLICRQRPRALILNTEDMHENTLTDLLSYQQNGGILISYDSPSALPCDQVIFDREENAYQSTKYLLEQGHRDIGFSFSLRRSLQSINSYNQYRLEGFQRALKEYGATHRPEWVFCNKAYEEGGAEMAQKYLALTHRPTALAIVNDYVALAFMVEIRKAGVRVPEDISVIGHDNQPIAPYCPIPLTTMIHPTEQIITTIMNRLIARLGGENAAPEQTTIRSEIVVRNSVCKKQP
jgi:DNA-binding LacI/PurR family transcriptional regulator